MGPIDNFSLVAGSEGDLVCDVQLGFARGSVHARVEVSVYGG